MKIISPRSGFGNSSEDASNFLGPCGLDWGSARATEERRTNAAVRRIMRDTPGCGTTYIEAQRRDREFSSAESWFPEGIRLVVVLRVPVPLHAEERARGGRGGVPADIDGDGAQLVSSGFQPLVGDGVRRLGSAPDEPVVIVEIHP